MKFDLNISANRSRKNILGKLLASENLSVMYSPTKTTASFDLRSRTIIMPIFKYTCSQYLVDLFLAHEASHALHTPAVLYKNTINKLTVKLTMEAATVNTYLNTVEDVRINRLIQSKYPGTKIDFRKGYQERYNRGDYGTTNPAVINNMNLIDRINIHAKAGHAVKVLFSAEETALVKEVHRAMTFEEVAIVTEKLLKYCQDNETQNQSSTRKKNKDSFEMKMDSYGIELEAVPADGDEQGDTDSLITPFEGEYESDQKIYIDQIESTTEKFETRTSENYVDTSQKTEVMNYKFYDDPTFVFDYKELFRTRKPVDTKNPSWKKSVDSLVSFMVHEFEMVKAAHDYTYQAFKSTGDLDLNSLAHYKTREDIFQKRVLLPEHKNHGFVFLVDMSQSMETYMKDTRKQVLLFVSLARRLNIPFEVYSFTDMSNSKHLSGISGFGLGKMFSSEMSKAEFDFMFNRWAYSTESMLTCCEKADGGTPLAKATLAMYPLIHDFVKKNRVEVFNFISVTDGDSTDCIGRKYGEDNVQITIEMRNNGKTFSTSKSLWHKDVLNLLKETLLEDGIQSNFIDFYIDDDVELFEVSKRQGYDESYQISPSLLGARTKSKDFASYAKSLSNEPYYDVHEAFADYSKNKSNHKKLLRKMVQKLAKFD